MADLQIVRVAERPGFYHRPDWYRPLLFGDSMYMNATYLMPGVGMVMASKKEQEIEPLEQAVYMLQGRVEITHGENIFELLPHMAILIPVQPGPQLEVKNNDAEIAMFISVFSPPPHPELTINTLDRLLQLYTEANLVVKSAEEMQDLLDAKK